MPSKRAREFGELRSELQVRLGFGSAGAAAGVNAPIMESFLRDANSQLYWLQDWKLLTVYDDVTFASGDTTVDYPLDGDGEYLVNPERITKIAVKLSDNTWHDLKPGIETVHYNTQTAIPGWPQRYEPWATHLELWPEAVQDYTLRIWGIKPLPRFTESEDTTPLDDGLVLSYAIMLGKNHYRHADAQTYASQVQGLLAPIRGKSFTQRVLNPDRQSDNPMYVRPLVEGRDI